MGLTLVVPGLDLVARVGKRNQLLAEVSSAPPLLPGHGEVGSLKGSLSNPTGTSPSMLWSLSPGKPCRGFPYRNCECEQQGCVCMHECARGCTSTHLHVLSLWATCCVGVQGQQQARTSLRGSRV